jgi:hypothetical protein
LMKPSGVTYPALCTWRAAIPPGVRFKAGAERRRAPVGGNALLTTRTGVTVTPISAHAIVLVHNPNDSRNPSVPPSPGKLFHHARLPLRKSLGTLRPPCSWQSYIFVCTRRKPFDRHRSDRAQTGDERDPSASHDLRRPTPLNYLVRYWEEQLISRWPRWCLPAMLVWMGQKYPAERLGEQ